MAAAVSLPRRVVAELVGTALLLATVVGSGTMGERLASGNTAIALLANAIATGAGLVALILTFGPISGAHFNPVVTVAIAVSRGDTKHRDHWSETLSYIAAQIAGAFVGVAIAHVMFGEPVLAASTHARAGFAQFISEVVATFGLLAVILGCARHDDKSRGWITPLAVGAYITAAYWFTSSTSFANPAVTMARSATNTFTGIRLADVPTFILAQLVGGGAATLLFHWLKPVRASKVIFACVHNAGRSQIAAAFFNELAHPDLARAVSAGTEPGSQVHPEVLNVMREVGLDLSNRKPQLLSDDLARDASHLITMGCGEACPSIPKVIRDDWPLTDPKGKAPEVVREIRDEIRNRVVALLEREGWAKTK